MIILFYPLSRENISVNVVNIRKVCGFVRVYLVLYVFKDKKIQINVETAFKIKQFNITHR